MKEIKLPQQEFIDYEYDFFNVPLSLEASFDRNLTIEDLKLFFTKEMFLDQKEHTPKNLPINELRKFSDKLKKENADWEKWLESDVMPLLEKENIAQKIKQAISNSLSELQTLLIQEIINKTVKREISIHLDKSNEKGNSIGKTVFEQKRGKLIPIFKANRGVMSEKEEILKDYEEKAIKILKSGGKLTLESLAEEVGKSTESVKKNLSRHWGLSFSQFKANINQKLKEGQK